MDVKSIIFFLLLIHTICNRSLAIEIFSDDEKFIRSKELVKNDPNEISTSEDISSISSEDIEEPPDHKIPYSEHENSEKDVATKPKYFAPGDWAKPSKEKNISIDFVPTKIYAQVRGTHTVKRAPREEAIEEANTDEEKLNALRLREVVKNSKVNTVYTEEGYEDSAYDHAGHTRDADFHEDFNRNLRNQLKEKHGEERTVPDKLIKRKGDHNEHDENNEENSRENYLESNLNPKLIVRNEIEILEKDLEREAEEVEGDSDIQLFDSKKLKQSTNSERKLTANDKISSNENNNHDRQEDETENENIYNKNPTDRITDVTTVYNNPERPIVDQSTSDYGKIVWDFLKTTTNNPLNEQEITLTRKDATTLSPNLQSPMLITTIPLNLPASYFLPTIKEIVTLPTVYQASQNYFPHGPNSETVNAGLITSIVQNNDQIWPRNTNVDNYVEFTDDPMIRSIISDTSNSWKPSTHSTIDQSSLKHFDGLVLSNESIESPTTILPEKNQTKNFQSDDIKIDNNDENYFSNPFIDRKKIKYKVLGRYKPEKSTKSSMSSRSRKENDLKDHSNDVKYNKNLNDQRTKYTKVLNYVMNLDRSKESNDLTNSRGPNEIKYIDFRVKDRPTASSELAIVDQSSVPIESETIIREPNDKNFLRNRPISSVDSFHGTSSLPIYKIDTSSLLGLLPPPPPPLPLSTQLLPPLNYQNKYHSVSFPYNNEEGYYRNIEPILKYAPVIIDLKRKSRTRRKRTAEYVKGEVNNGTTNREEINQDKDNIFRVTKDGRNSRVTEGSRNNDYEERTRQRTISKSLDDKKPHEELLNEAPKITTLVVDKEIEERFNKDNEKSNNEKLENQRKNDEVNVEVEIPTNYDYIEELANEKVEKLPVVEEITKIDLKKYPFYKNERISDLSGLKYALNPRKIPRKTSTGMEFYDSRDVYKNCEEIDGNLDEVLPKEERPSNDRDPSIHKPRLRGLGEKLDCFKAKYFDENPFDNPLFMEKNVGNPYLPKELDPKKLSKRVLMLPIGTSEEYVSEKLSRKPERDSYHPYLTQNLKGERKISKNQPKKERISASLELSSAPYHRQIYEDVMNNIKESTNIYRNHRMTTINPSTLTESISADAINVKTFDSKTNLSDIETDSNTTRIDGLLPPKEPNDFGKINGPRRNRITRKSRRRPSLYHVPKTIRRYHKITIQKRSIKKPIGRSKLVDSITEKNANENIKNVTNRFNTTLRPRRRKFSVVSKNLTSSADDSEKDSSSRIVYTIRDRIKHLKPKDEVKNVGKFTRESRTLDEDSRRKEPRYNSVERKRNNFDSSTVFTILSTIWSDDSNVSETTTPSTISNKHLRYSTLSRDGTRMDSQEYLSKKESIRKDNNNYKIHENMDDISTTPTAILSTTSLEYSNYLISDPPGAFSEETTISPIVEETQLKVSNGDLEEDFKSNEHSHESIEDSLEKKKKDEEDEGTLETKERDVSKEEDKTFFSYYSSRPYSPSENYEDEKYSELGSRINKPAFYHPPFSMQRYETSSISPFEESSEETVNDENKKKTRHISFPWSSEDERRDKNSFEESKSIPFWSYEFPWEKRERLAREQRRERKTYGKLDDFSSRDSNEDVSSSKDTHTHFYPWELYDIPLSKKQKINRQERYFDTEESSSLHKPVKYSSKYNSSNLKLSKSVHKNFNHIHIDPEKLKGKKDRTGSSNHRRIITGNLVPEDITLAPRKDIGRRRMVEENNLTEVTSVATIKHKNHKNTTKKEILKKEQVESNTLRFPINTETTIKPNNVTVDRSRRRRILKKNVQINNDVKKYSTKPVIEQVKRRKIRPTTTAPTTITTTTTTTTFVSTKKLIRQRPQTRYQKTNNQFSEMKHTLPTPSTTTIEHRSRVSKESFIRTTYPDNENSSINANDNPGTLKMKHYSNNNEINRNRGNITSENVERISMTTKETPDHVYRTKKIDKDGVKEMFISIEPNKAKNITELDDPDISEFTKKDNNWRISQDLDLSGIPSTESYLTGNLLGQTLESYSRNDRGFKDGNIKLEEIKEKNKKEEKEEEENKEEEEKNNKIKSSIKFLHHPEQRLYYYVERRK